MEPRAEYRNGIMYVVYDDGEAIPLAEVMKYNNPSMDFDPATGDPLGPAAPPAGLTEADMRAQAALEPERLRAQDTFGDTTMRMAQPYIDSAIDLAANAGRRPTYFTDPLMGGVERVGQYVGDMGMAGLSGLGALGYGGAGLMGEVFGGSQSDERMLARDLAAGIDVAGVGPEARAFGLLSDAVRAERGGVGNMTRGFLAGESGSVPLPFSSSNPVTERGAQIIDMLTSGRADEITDQMLDMGDPVLNANLNQYLYRNYDLPMDEASRMARAEQMGLTEDTIHGTLTKTDFTGFKGADRYGSLIGQENYVAPNTVDGKKLAEQFSTGDQGRILPLRTPKPLDTSTLDDRLRFEQMMDDKNRLNDFRMNGGYKPSGLPSWGAQWAIDTANEAGEKGIRLHERDWVDSTAIFNPKDIRSRFARFDPRLAHLRNLSAGIAPFGLLALQPNEEQY